MAGSSQLVKELREKQGPAFLIVRKLLPKTIMMLRKPLTICGRKAWPPPRKQGERRIKVSFIRISIWGKDRRLDRSELRNGFCGAQ